MNSNNKTPGRVTTTPPPPPPLPPTSSSSSSRSNHGKNSSSAFPTPSRLSRSKTIPLAPATTPCGPYRSATVPTNSSTFETPTREQLTETSVSTFDVSPHVLACRADSFVDRRKCGEIRLVAIDFDLTLLRVHTSGRWMKCAEQLVSYIRPVFRQLIPALLRENIICAIVSFSPQVDLIRRVVKLAFPNDAKLGENIFVRGSVTDSPPHPSCSTLKVDDNLINLPQNQQAQIHHRSRSSTSKLVSTTTNNNTGKENESPLISLGSNNNNITKNKNNKQLQLNNNNLVTIKDDEDDDEYSVAEMWSPRGTGKRAHIDSVIRQYHQSLLIGKTIESTQKKRNVYSATKSYL